MEQNLVEHAAENIAVTLGRGSDLNRFGNSAAEAARCAGMVGEDLFADISSHAGRGSNRRAVGTHNLAAEGLLLVRNLNHVNLAVKSEV